MTSSWFFWVFVACYALHQTWETALTLLNNTHIRAHANEVPKYFHGKIEPERYRKAVAYNLEKARFGLVVRGYDVVLTWAILFSGVLNRLDVWVADLVPQGIFHSVAYCGAVALALLVLKIPVSLYSHFVLEEKYGFNKMTGKTFVADLLKGLSLGAVLGGPILAIVFWLYARAGSLWWLWAFGAVYGFEFMMAAVYPTFLAPIFNKFTPLPDGSLKEAITTLAAKIRFKMSGIFTIDGSRRSGHSNAYFAGMGRLRRIVLFDTLQKQLTEREIIAVLGHEMGHNKLKHIQKMLVLGFMASLTGFWILSILIDWQPLYDAFNAGPPAPHKALVIAALFGPHFTFLFNAVTNALSRRYEYASDRFSVEVVGDKEAMASSLVALSRENLSNLTPHPLYSFYHYTHPTTLERVRAIQQTS
jgi:STE24 endopeptidase